MLSRSAPFGSGTFTPSLTWKPGVGYPLAGLDPLGTCFTLFWLRKSLPASVWACGGAIVDGWPRGRRASPSLLCFLLLACCQRRTARPPQRVVTVCATPGPWHSLTGRATALCQRVWPTDTDWIQSQPGRRTHHAGAHTCALGLRYCVVFKGVVLSPPHLCCIQRGTCNVLYEDFLELRKCVLGDGERAGPFSTSGECDRSCPGLAAGLCGVDGVFAAPSIASPCATSDCKLSPTLADPRHLARRPCCAGPFRGSASPKFLRLAASEQVRSD